MTMTRMMGPMTTTAMMAMVIDCLRCTSPFLFYTTIYTLFYSSAMEQGLFMTAYKEILRLIPKLKPILPYKANGNAEYFYNMVDAVSNAHIPCYMISHCV